MTNQTGEWGLRLEELYDRCMALSPADRDPFIGINTCGDAAMAAQLRLMIKLEDPTAANPLQSGPAPHERGIFELTGGTEFGRCKIVNGYGSGGMGTVYLARDLENHDRPVALKVMKPHFLRKQDRQRFTVETAALSRLVHPNIARLYYWGIQPWDGNPRPFLVMEFIDGSTLGKYLAEKKPPPRQVLSLLRKICRAVHYGHLQGVYHRDLKPSNILVTADGEPKLIDFGVSFTVDKDKASDDMAGLEENVGTPAYMAPEVAGRLPYQADARTDVYSLGVIAFEAITGRRPGTVGPGGAVQSLDEVNDPSKVRQLISQQPRERLSTARYGRDLESVVAKALCLETDARYSDADKLAEDFRRLLDLETVTARPQTRRYSAQKFVRRNRLAVTAGALVFAALLAAAVVFRVGELRVRAALEEIKRQDAAAHARAGELAEQRGNWAAADDEYRLAQDAGYPDQLKLAVGRLRALDRLGRSADADALIDHIHRTNWRIAHSPRFQIVQGFYEWTTNPDDSLMLINAALRNADQLPPADRAFAAALTTDDVPTAAADLRETIKADPFNHDALALLTLCDLVQGQTAQGESDGMLMQRLYPQDATGSVLAAFGAALDGRKADAEAHLNENTALPEKIKTSLGPAIDFIARNHSVDALQSLAPDDQLTLAFTVGDGAASLIGMPSLTQIHRPRIFSRFAPTGDTTDLLSVMADQKKLMEMVAQWPNGDGQFAAGDLALLRGDIQAAEDHFRRALSEPAPIDCHRIAAMYLMLSDAKDPRLPHTPGSPGFVKVTADAETLIALGGIDPVRSPQERLVLQTAAEGGLYPQLRTMAMTWLTRVPADPEAMYYVALAESHLGRPQTAIFYYDSALSKKLPQDLADKAKPAVAELKAAATTRPTTQPVSQPATRPS